MAGMAFIMFVQDICNHAHPIDQVMLVWMRVEPRVPAIMHSL